MELQYMKWRQNQSVSEQYLNDFDSVRELFEYDYREKEAYIQRVEWIEGNAGKRAVPDSVIEVLLKYNDRVGNHPQAIEALKQLIDPRALVVVGGQQAGLFTGPLLVIHKAISILREARRAAEQLGRPVVPVFWIAGEDHDYDEVNHIYQLSGQLTVDKIEIPADEAQAGRRLTVSRRPISAQQWETAIAQLEATLMQTEFKAGWMQLLRDSCLDSISLSDSFARIMAHLFGEFGLVLLDSDDPALRAVEAPMFRELVKHNVQLEKALWSAKSKMQALGHEPSADVREGGANLFWLQDGERLLLQRRDSDSVSDDSDEALFFDRSEVVRFSGLELAEQVDNSPDRFSNNVFTRPLMQDFLFPVLGTVLGPGEIAYWGLTKEAFHAFDMQMPIIVPRTEFTLVEGTIKKQLSKLELTFEETVFHLEEKKEKWLTAQDSLGIAEQFADVKRQFEELYAPVLQMVASINPGLKGLGETNHQKIVEQIEFLENRAKDAFESQFDAAKRQFERIKQSLTPLGKRQERVYNVFAYLNKYGADWLKVLIEAELEENGQHVVVYM